MVDLTAEQKIRYKLTGHPYQEPNFQHEGPTVVRWLTGGPAPTVQVQFQQEGSLTVLFCPHCGEKLGQLDMTSENVYQDIAEIRQTGSDHQKQHQVD